MKYQFYGVREYDHCPGILCRARCDEAPVELMPAFAVCMETFAAGACFGRARLPDRKLIGI